MYAAESNLIKKGRRKISYRGARIFHLRTTELGIIEPKLLIKRKIDLKARLTSHITDPQKP